ncbi:MAG: hypothetical protein KIS87_03065 [Phycisphaeraceae bacterium]|nr:hypothetical protein [Phycisphaeraceae bacterium]
MRSVVAVLGVVSLSTAPAFAQSSRDIVRTDATGATVVRTLGPVQDTGHDGAVRAGILWTLHDPISIVESVAVGDTTNESWLAHNLNDKRVSKMTTNGTGVPDFVYSMAAENPSSIGVASAETASLGVVISFPTGGPVNVRGFTNSGGNVPIWTYTFPAGHNNASKRNVDASANGSVVVAAAYDGANSTVVILNGATGAFVNSFTRTGFISGLELSDDGSRVLITNGANAELVEVASLATLRSFSVSGAGGFHRLSRDGKVIAAGGFNIRIDREVGGVWSTAYSGTGSNQWFGWGMAVSGDGKYAIAASHDYVQNYLPNNYRVIDVTTGQVIATDGYIGSGGFQNSMVGAEANSDGTIFTVASWGDAVNTKPEVRIFDRSLTEIGSIDTIGSPFGLDMTIDGRYVLVGAKSVHANTFGSGGMTYLYEVFVACAADFNGDTVVNTLDFIAFLNAFTANDPRADFNGDTVINTLDFIAFLNAFTAGCP